MNDFFHVCIFALTLLVLVDMSIVSNACFLEVLEGSPRTYFAVLLTGGGCVLKAFMLDICICCKLLFFVVRDPRSTNDHSCWFSVGKGRNLD